MTLNMNRTVNNVKVYIGGSDNRPRGSEGPSLTQDGRFQLAGEGQAGSSQILTQGIGTHIKLVLTPPSTSTKLNPARQMGLKLIRVFGQPVKYHHASKQDSDVSHASWLLDVTNKVSTITDQAADQVRLELGLSFKGNSKSTNLSLVGLTRTHAYAQVDDETRQTLHEIEEYRALVESQQDFEKLQQIDKDLNKLLMIGQQILALKRQISVEIANSQFQKSAQFRNEIKSFERQRDKIDADYGTTRFEDLILFEVDRDKQAQHNTNEFNVMQAVKQEKIDVYKRVSDQQKIRDLNQKTIMAQNEIERMIEESLKPAAGAQQIQNDESNQDNNVVWPSAIDNKDAPQPVVQFAIDQDIDSVRQRPTQEQTQEAKERQERMAAKRKRQQEAISIVSDKKKTSPRVDKQKREKAPLPEVDLDLNEGDHEFQPFLDPILGEGTIELRTILKDQAITSSFTPSEELMLLIGNKMWACLNSTQWRHRDAAAQALYKYLENVDQSKNFQNQPLEAKIVRNYFILIKLILEDKLLQLYTRGISILDTLMKNTRLVNQLNQRVVQKEVRNLTKQLLIQVDSIQENWRDPALIALQEIYANGSIIDSSKLIEEVMDVTKKSKPVSKLPEREVHGRLELLSMIVKAKNAVPETWNWENVLGDFITPCLGHANVEIRQQAVRIAQSFCRNFGQEAVDLVQQRGQELDFRNKLLDKVIPQLASPGLKSSNGGNSPSRPVTKGSSKTLQNNNNQNQNQNNSQSPTRNNYNKAQASGSKTSPKSSQFVKNDFGDDLPDVQQQQDLNSNKINNRKGSNFAEINKRGRNVQQSRNSLPNVATNVGNDSKSPKNQQETTRSLVDLQQKQLIQQSQFDKKNRKFSK